MNDLSKRLCSGIIGILLLFFIIIKGGFLLYVSVYIISIIGLREFYKAIENLNINPIYIIGYISTTSLFLNNILKINYLDFILTITTIVLLLALVFKSKATLLDISITILGILYIPFMLIHIVYLDKTKYIWLIFIIAFGTDTFAYLAGNLFGKHKLCPTISPNKTIEGSIGGVLGSILLVIVYSIYFKLGSIANIILLTIISSIIAQLGDLTASRIKRICGIKDYGSIMPGHGGVLDRFDSIIFTTPVIYYYISSFIN